MSYFFEYSNVGHNSESFDGFQFDFKVDKIILKYDDKEEIYDSSSVTIDGNKHVINNLTDINIYKVDGEFPVIEYQGIYKSNKHIHTGGLFALATDYSLHGISGPYTGADSASNKNIQAIGGYFNYLVKTNGEYKPLSFVTQTSDLDSGPGYLIGWKIPAVTDTMMSGFLNDIDGNEVPIIGAFLNFRVFRDTFTSNSIDMSFNSLFDFKYNNTTVVDTFEECPSDSTSIMILPTSNTTANNYNSGIYTSGSRIYRSFHNNFKLVLKLNDSRPAVNEFIIPNDENNNGILDVGDAQYIFSDNHPNRLNEAIAISNQISHINTVTPDPTITDNQALPLNFMGSFILQHYRSDYIYSNTYQAYFQELNLFHLNKYDGKNIFADKVRIDHITLPNITGNTLYTTNIETHPNNETTFFELNLRLQSDNSLVGESILGHNGNVVLVHAYQYDHQPPSFEDANGNFVQNLNDKLSPASDPARSNRFSYRMAMSKDGQHLFAPEFTTGDGYNTPFGDIYVSNDYGKTWSTKGGPEIPGVQYYGSWGSVSCTDDGQYVMVTTVRSSGTKGYGNLVSNDYGQTWNIDVSLNNELVWYEGQDPDTGEQVTEWRDVSYNYGYGFGSAMSSDGKYKLVTHGSSDYRFVTRGFVQTNDYGTTWYRVRQSELKNDGSTVNRPWQDCAISSDGKYAMICCRTGGGTGYPFSNDSHAGLWTCERDSTTDKFEVWTHKLTNTELGTSPLQEYRAGGTAMSADGKYQLFAYRNTAYLSSDYGNTFPQIQLSDPFSDLNGAGGACMSNSGKIMYIIDINGIINYSSNYGLTWNNTTTTKFHPWGAIACTANGDKVLFGTNRDNPDTGATGELFLIPPPPPVTDYQFATKSQLQTAVDLWISDNASALIKYGDINTWDTSLITNMSALFQNKSTFDSDISNWNVSSVTNMSTMFGGASSFNKPLNSWDVSNVTDMYEMFSFASSFDQEIRTWTLKNSSVDLTYMFQEATAFKTKYYVNNTPTTSFFDFTAGVFTSQVDLNSVVQDWVSDQSATASIHGDINTWDVSQIEDMSTLFSSTTFNSNISNWNVSNVSNMSGMFNGTPFNQDISAWIVTNVTNMNNMFWGCNDFNQPIGNWNVSNVKTFSNTFNSCKTFNQPIGNWSVSNVTDMSTMFADAEAFNQDIRTWDLNQSVNLSNMFYNATAFLSNYGVLFTPSKSFWPFVPNTKTELSDAITTWINNNTSALSTYGDINTWDTSLITNMSDLFKNKSTFDSNISNWNVSNVTNMNEMFASCSTFNQPLNAWDVSSVTNMEGMFLFASSFNKPLDSWNVSNVVNMRAMFTYALAFDQEIRTWILNSNVDLLNMFNNATAFKQKYSVNDTPTSSWFVIPHIFEQKHPDYPTGTGLQAAVNLWISDNASALATYGDINTWNVSNVKDMSSLFKDKNTFNSDISNWDVSNVTVMAQMFQNCYIFDKPLNSWNVSNVTNMGGIFNDARAFNQPLNSWNVSNVTTMSGVFQNALLFNQPINTWNVSNVNSLETTFYNAEAFNQPLNSWDTKNVTTMFATFSNTEVFNQDIKTWNVSNVASFTNMFDGATAMPSGTPDTPDANYFTGPFTSKNDLQTAVNLWISDNASALSTYGEINTWDTSLITDMKHLFVNKTFNSDISNWNVSNVTTTFGMFGASSFNQSLNSWDVSKVTTMQGMFNGAQQFNKPLDGWDVSNVKNMSEMFYDALSFNQDITNWNTSSVTLMGLMFYNAQLFNHDIRGWNVSSVDVNGGFFNMFNGAQNMINNYSAPQSGTPHAYWFNS